MENLRIKMVFFNYYIAILGRFYSEAQKDKILYLIAQADGIENEQINEFIKISRYIENEEIGNPVGCKNFLLYAFFKKDISPVLYGAITALNDIFVSGQGRAQYSNELVWHRTVQKDNDYLEIGFYEYARGRYEKSIEAFEKAMRSEKKLPLVEYLAIIASEAKNHQKAYEYSLRAQVISEDERLNIDWLMNIENSSKSYLTDAEREKIEKSVFNQKSSSKIGFGQ
jgi:tetratricopeptide (TPR) repeat protein